MEKLSRRSDGAYETPSGLFAVAPRAVSGKNAESSWFEFKATVLAEITRVEWPTGAPVIVIDQTVARSMLKAGYANAVTDDQMNAYNDAVDAYLKANPEAQQPEPPAPPQEPDAAASAAGAPETPAPPPPPPAPTAEEPADSAKKKSK